MAELIDLVAMQDIHPDNGLSEIKFSHFIKEAEEKEVGDLDEGVLDRLVEFSKKLTKLTVSYMKLASDYNRKELVYFTQKIMNLRPTLTHIDFHELFTS